MVTHKLALCLTLCVGLARVAWGLRQHIGLLDDSALGAAAATRVQASLGNAAATRANASAATTRVNASSLILNKYKEVQLTGVSDLMKEYEVSLLPGEEIKRAYKKGARTFLVFTTRRLLNVGKKKVTKKVSYTAIAWDAVLCWSVQSAGAIELIRADTELRIWTALPAQPFLQWEFWKDDADIFKMKTDMTRLIFGAVPQSGKGKSLAELDSNLARADPVRGIADFLGDNNKEINPETAYAMLSPKSQEGVLIENEKVEMAFKGRRDLFIMTNLRVLELDIKGFGTSTEYKSIPYKHMRAYAVETAGMSLGAFVGDTDSELTLWTAAPTVNGFKFKFTFSAKQGGADILAIQSLLASKIFRVPWTYRAAKSSLVQLNESIGEEGPIGGAIAWLGNNSEQIDAEEAAKTFRKTDAGVLLEGERVHYAFKVGRDHSFMTEHRLLLVDVKGVRGKKREYVTIPWTSVQAFSVQTAGTFDTDSELMLYTDVNPGTYGYDDSSAAGQAVGIALDLLALVETSAALTGTPTCGQSEEICIAVRKIDFRKGAADLDAIQKFIAGRVFGESSSGLESQNGKASRVRKPGSTADKSRNSRSLAEIGSEVDVAEGEIRSESDAAGPKDVLAWFGGDASEVDAKEAQKEMSHLLLRGEDIRMAFKVGRDMTFFTDKRIVVHDRKGMTGAKNEYLSVPFSKVVAYAVETAGVADLDAELRFYTPMAKGLGLHVIKQDLRKDKVDLGKISTFLNDRMLSRGGGSSLLQEDDGEVMQADPFGNAVAWLGNNANEVDSKTTEAEFRKQGLLQSDEKILKAYRIGRDSIVVSNKRVLKTDVKGAFGRKVEWTSVPWRHCKGYMIRTAGAIFDFDAEFSLMTTAAGYPKFTQDLRKGKTSPQELVAALSPNLF